MSSLSGMPVQDQPSSGMPVFYRVSTDNDPTHKTLQVQSDAALTYAYRSQQGVLLGVSQAPDGTSPHVATWPFPQLPYPVTIEVEVFDSASQSSMGSQLIQLTGADVYKVRVAYQQNIPAAHGFMDAMVDGSRQTVFGQDYASLWNTREDVWPRGSD
jgi:hypothetical protein